MTRQERPMPALELSFRLQCARMLAAQIKTMPVREMRRALARHAVADPTHDAFLLAIFEAAQTGLLALDRLERAKTPPPLPVTAELPIPAVKDQS